MDANEQKAVTDQLWNDPVAFLQTNHLFYRAPESTFGGWNRSVADKVAPGSGHHPLYFEIEEAEIPVVGLDGSKGRYFYATPARKGTLVGYFLPWHSDAGYNLVLGKDAFFFFNALMDGCGFGCIPGPSGSLKVAHHNIQSGGDGTSHAAMASSLAGYSTTMNRDGYRWQSEKAEGQCSIIGVRGRLTGWWVIAQRFSMKYSNAKVTITAVDRLV